MYDDSEWAHEMSDEPEANEPECLEQGPDCNGLVEFHMNPDRNDFKAFPRCEFHQARRLDKAEQTMRRYPMTAPRDFDPAYAGESWDED